jgi:AcrR family transcriptional regulator
MTAQRWGGDAPVSVDHARERIIDSAERCIERFGPSKTTIDDIAAAADISRATVYRYFANRDEILLGVLLRASERTERRIWRAASRATTVEQWFVESFLATLREVPKDRMMRLMFTTEEGPEMARVVEGSDVFLQRTIDRLGPMFERAKADGLLRDGVDPHEASEWIERLCMSFLAYPPAAVNGTGGERRVRRMLEKLLVPVLFDVEE